jgi:iron complex outermembrane receptor protein/outer membrane receptor for ferrienterochelin and colicins
MYYQFYNAANSVVTKGFDTYISATLEGFEIYAGYTYTMATRNYMIVNKAMPLTPMHRAAFTIVREWESKGFRVGLESSYNGSQHRLDGSSTPGYLFMAAMADKKIGTHLRIVLNCENLLDYRQSKVESLYTGTISNPQFKELWAPIDGRVANLAIFISI